MNPSLYINLLKDTLSFSLWPEPPRPIGLARSTVSKSFVKRYIVPRVKSALDRLGMELAVKSTATREDRETGRIWPSYADTMVGRKRLDNIQFCVESVLKDNVPGDMIETGVWRGGSCILMRGILKAHDVTDRKVFVADSFEGLPPPTLEVDTHDIFYSHPYLAVSQENVAWNFKKYDLLDNQVVFIKGWFKDTLHLAPVDKLAVLRLDGDMYTSTMEALDPLYPKLSPGGFCIVDDYGNVEACKKAVTDYRARHNITEPIIDIDGAGVYWRKAF